MANSERDHAEQIPNAIWMAWCNYFSNKYYRRHATIDLVADKDGQEGGGRLAFKLPLVAVDYDPEGKGNALVISYGDETAPSRHMISAPATLWRIDDDDGTVRGFLVEDEVGGVTIVTFE